MESDPDPSVRSEALHFLLLREDPTKAGELAKRWLQHGSSDVRARIVEALAKLAVDKQILLTPLLSDPSPAVRSAALCGLWNVERSQELARAALVSLLADDNPEAHGPALAACHRTGECPDPTRPLQILGSNDPVARVLAGTAVLRFCADPATHGAALEMIFQTIADESCADRLRAEVLPLVPDLGEDASDAILLAAAKLPPEFKARVAFALGEWHQAIESRIEAAE